MAQPMESPDGMGYQLVDAGVRRRLERFGRWVVDRPAPGVEGFRLGPASAWDSADLRFDPGAGWSGPAWPAAPWPIEVDGLTMELRPTASGGVGLYPEHAANLHWLAEQAAARAASGAAPRVLHLFAHTGLATLALARAGASVAHVDAARTAVAWARRNAELSGLADRPVRWLVDDAWTFVLREARRARRYDGFVLDPPSFGRAGTRQWRIADELPELLEACHRVAAEDAFVLLTAHTTGLDGGAMRDALRTAFGGRHPIAVGPLELSSEHRALLPLGWAARLG